MKKIVKTAEELRRDELVMEVRSHKETMESLVRNMRRRQRAMELLPEFSEEYKEYESLVKHGKCELVLAMRNYEASREILGEHCKTYKLAGNTFIPAMDLLGILADNN